MARISYTSFRFQAPPLMGRDSFEVFKTRTVDEERLQPRPSEGFRRTFPGWCIFFGLLFIVSVYMYFQGEDNFWAPLIAWPLLAMLSGNLHSMGSWLLCRSERSSYYRLYALHINESRDYDELVRCRKGLHSEPMDSLSGLIPNERQKQQPKPRIPKGPWQPL